MSKLHLLITDMQHAPGKPVWHMELIAALAEDYEPDTVVQVGDWNDCESLGSWERGKKEAWGRAHQKDCDHSRKALALLEEGLGYGPRKIALEGNHDGSEHSRGSRMYRLIQDHPELSGSLECPMAPFAENGWEVVPFLTPITVDGISYCHLFPLKADGDKLAKGNAASTALTQLSGLGHSCVAGHSPGIEFACRPFGDKVGYSVKAGSGYPQKLGYQGPQGSSYWRGVLLLHVYKKGVFDLEMWSLDRLKQVYG